MSNRSKLLNKLTNLFNMDTTPKSMESIKEEIIQQASINEESVLPVDGEELKPFNKLTEEQKEEIRDSIGGREEYNNMMTWVYYFLPEDEDECYRWIINAGQVQPIIFATARVYEKYQASCKEEDGLEDYIKFCTEINSVDNQYSVEVIQAFRAIRALKVNGFKDYLQLARVMCSYAEYDATGRVEAELEKKKPNMMGVKYCTATAAVLHSAKQMLWNIDLPHEMENRDS